MNSKEESRQKAFLSDQIVSLLVTAKKLRMKECFPHPLQTGDIKSSQSTGLLNKSAFGLELHANGYYLSSEVAMEVYALNCVQVNSFLSRIKFKKMCSSS